MGDCIKSFSIPPSLPVNRKPDAAIQVYPRSSNALHTRQPPQEKAIIRGLAPNRPVSLANCLAGRLTYTASSTIANAWFRVGVAAQGEGGIACVGGVLGED